MTSRVTFVTPTYGRDLQRFALLRESMERCEIDIPHVAVVQHEDLPLLRDMPFRHKLTLISTRDALPANIERRRVTPVYRRRHPYHWIKPHSLHGWFTQQIVKLRAPQYLDSEGALCLDSDVFFVGCVREADFFADDGQLHLYETQNAFTVESIKWMADSMSAMNLPLGQPPYQYIHHPVPLQRDVVLGMQKALEAIHGKSWIDVFIDKQLTEYTTYGVYARHVNGLKHVTPVAPPFTLVYWSDEQLAGYKENLLERIRAKQARVVCINSGIGRPVDEYRELVESIWTALGR